MATDLETRSSPKQSEAYLQRKFADLSARVKRVDLLTHLLALALTVAGYALLIGWLDWFAGGSKATIVYVLRWTGFGVLVGVTALVLVLTARCLLRRVNPYFVADQLERTSPEAKNSLINWLDLHEQGLPSAFQKHLSTRASDHFDALDSERTLPKRRNRILLGMLAVPTLGLMILLLLGPAAFLASMLRAFAPFYAPPEIARTQITLLEPGGDTEVGPAQALTFAAKIDGRIPPSHRPDAPRLLYRYQANEDYFALPLQAEGAGTWAAQLSSEQLRTGFSYKVAAGDAETPEHQVRVRGRAHVKQFEITYHYRPYLQHAKTTVAFPNKAQATPIIHGLRGTEVELIVHASRPVKKANITIILQDVKTDLPTRLLSDDPHAFACRFTLEKSGQFRVRFTATDGEENVDRGDYPIDVRPDEAPTVLLTKPAADVSIAENGTLTIEGRASDDFGVKGLALHVRVLTGPHKPALQPKIYRAGKPLQFADGSYPDALDYQDYLALDELKDAKGTTHILPQGTVLEYWLEATDNADYPNPTGNVGKSAAYKITLLPKSNDAAKTKAERDTVRKRQADHEQRQDDHLAQKKQSPQSNPGGADSQNGPNDPRKQEQQIKDDKAKLDKAADSQDQKQGPGQAKGSNSPNPDKKDSNDSKEGPGPKDKSPKSKSPDSAGNNKDKGDGKGGAGESKDGGPDAKTQEPTSKGPPKDGSKGEAKSGGPKGDSAPAPQQPKDQGSGDPMPTAKQAPKDAPLAQDKGNSQGAEQSGPEVGAKDGPTTQAPMPGAKGSNKNDPDANNAEPKQAPQEAQNAGQPRGQNAAQADQGAEWDRLAKLVAKVAEPDGEGDAARKELADIAKNSDDPRKREIAKEILEKNKREPDTGQEKKKAPNPYGSNGPTKGISDDIKADAVNREFMRRIGQMQFDDWKKRITPEVLKKAGMSEADFERFVKSMQAYDALVQKRNAELLRKQVQELRGKGASGSGLRVVEGPEGNSDPLDRRSTPPPELRDVQRRFERNP
jgi:hypothetical protein